MHQGEVRSFRGNIETHLLRLNWFSCRKKTIDVEAVTSLEWSDVRLRDTQREIDKSSPRQTHPFLRFAEILLSKPAHAVVIAIPIAAVIGPLAAKFAADQLVVWEPHMGVVLMSSIGIAVVAAIIETIVDYRRETSASNRRINESFEVQHRKNAAEWLLWMMLLPLVPVVWLIDRWSRRR